MNNLTKLQTQKVCTALLASLMATCSTSPSYADQEYVLTATAKTGNNGRQELRKLFKPVQHHTIVDVFLCLPFIFLPVMGELRLAIALLALWWGGYRNKPFIRQILCAVGLTVFEPPCRPNFGANHQNIITLRKG